MKLRSLLVLLFLTACESDPSDPRAFRAHVPTGILGGELVPENSPEARALVLLSFPDGNLCSGTLIGENLVLTAGHCIPDKIQEVTLLFGPQPFAQRHPPQRPVISFRRHEDFKHPQRGRNDVAVLKFSGPRPPGTLIVSLPVEDDQFFLNASFVAVGYGVTSGLLPPETDGAGLLRRVDLKIAAFYREAREFSANQQNGRGACFGDSGGPALIWREDGTPVAIGIESGVFYTGTKPPEDPCQGFSLYMNVLAYRAWIIQASIDLIVDDLAQEPAQLAR